MGKTDRSGLWLFRCAFRRGDVFSSLLASCDWVKKGSYHTAWPVLPLSACSCSYAYGQGRAIRSQIGERCWSLLTGVWRAVAPLMKPWCAERVLPTASNLNLYRGRFSRAAWHSDNEPLFGEPGESKLIVSMSFGTRARFKWKEESCPDSEADSCWLDHGDLLVMDGRCQDEFSFIARILVWSRNGLTLRSVRSTKCCFLSLSEDRGGMLFANVCAGFIRLCYGVCGERRCLETLGAPSGSAHLGGISFAELPPLYVWDLNYAGVPLAGYVHRAEFGGGIVFVVLWAFTR